MLAILFYMRNIKNKKAQTYKKTPTAIKICIYEVIIYNNKPYRQTPYLIFTHLDNNQMSWKVHTPCQCAGTNQYLQLDDVPRQHEIRTHFFLPGKK
jgi:hypothetical protein